MGVTIFTLRIYFPAQIKIISTIFEESRLSKVRENHGSPPRTFGKLRFFG